MAHKKGVGSSKNGRESESKRLGVKIFGGPFHSGSRLVFFVFHFFVVTLHAKTKVDRFGCLQPLEKMLKSLPESGSGLQGRGRTPRQSVMHFSWQALQSGHDFF